MLLICTANTRCENTNCWRSVSQNISTINRMKVLNYNDKGISNRTSYYDLYFNYSEWLTIFSPIFSLYPIGYINNKIIFVGTDIYLNLDEFEFNQNNVIFDYQQTAQQGLPKRNGYDIFYLPEWSYYWMYLRCNTQICNQKGNILYILNEY